MGVHGLWELLSPVGRRVSVETLAGKKLAIDASIWMIQFMKAMRDEKGEMVRNAHVLGFFRRICKLLFLRTKPVFVFDGATPALKRRTVIARRRQRENAQAKIRKTAEKLLLNHLKAMKLKELAKDLENQKKRNDAKGKKVISDQTETAGNNSEMNDTVSRSCNQETLDEMLAASLAAEEKGGFTGNASTSGPGIPYEEDDDDEDEEMILPTMHGKVDPAVLAALPPSMQLDLLVQMRERLMAENRQKYHKVKKAPAKFSELQIQAYLKTVAFRREIDEVQKSAAGRGVGGVQTSRIASEANREFIFSSSFTGDKQVLTSAGVERNGDMQCQNTREHPTSDSLDSIASTVKSTEIGSVADEPRQGFDDDVQTYLDERGRVRVNRLRAMGICMTRDLQRNLDLMKDIEQERMNANNIVNTEPILNEKVLGVPRSFCNKKQLSETSDGGNDEPVNLNGRLNSLLQGENHKEQSMSKNENSIEISFEDDIDNKCVDSDDDLFARLVAGDPVMISSADNNPSQERSFDSASDCDWEEGIIKEKGDCFTNNVQVEIKPCLAEGSISDESEVEWEEGDGDVIKNASPYPDENMKVVSRGFLEEEADLQEAIRRSLEDVTSDKSVDASSEDELIKTREMAHEGTIIGFLHQENDRAEPNLPLNNVMQENGSLCEAVAGVEKPDNVGGMNSLQTIDSSGRQLTPSMANNPDNMEVRIHVPCERHPVSHPELSRQDASESGSSYREILCAESGTPIKTNEVHLIVEQLLDSSNGGGQISTFPNGYSGVCPHISDRVLGDMPAVTLGDGQQNDSESAPCHSKKTTDLALPQGESSVKEAATGIDMEQKLAEEKDHDNFFKESKPHMHESAIKNDMKDRVEVTEASLEEEMLILGQERINLGDEQRKLERNAESVSSEMFAECQELLQMFGLPYIIAPMEAEAQCAYMELANLVDGVVTDDSDVFLFGARSVYKNIFDDRKYVETYFMKDIESELGLTREKLTRMALLLGSDYTEGVSGIGIVNAIEVVNAFPEKDGLHKFREWIESPDPTILKKFDVQTGSSLRKRGLKVSESDVSYSNSNIEGVSAFDQNVCQVDEDKQCVDNIQNIKKIFMDKHRNVSKNWHIPSSFPSEAVISEYSSPHVDKSTDPFSWGKPDVSVLRKLCWEKFGWIGQKADELLLPVLKEYSKHETQLRLEAFYTFNEKFAKIRSKRISKAVKGITGNQSLELMDDAVQEVSKSRKKRRVSPSEPGDTKSEKASSGIEDGVTRDESNSTEKSTAKKSRKRRIQGGPVQSEAGNPEPPMQAEGRRNTNKGSNGNGRGRGKGRGQGVGKGRRKGSPGFEFSETSSSDGNGSDNVLEVQVEKLGGPHEVRRSTRPRKAVKYAVDDLEIDEVGKSLDQKDEKCTDEEAVERESSCDRGIFGDAVGGLSEKNQHKTRDHSLEDRLCREHLEMGGGFCMDEGEPEIQTGQLGSSQNDGPFEAEFSKVCLKIGGGFCMDEGDETDKDPDECASNPASATIFGNADPSRCSGFIDEADHDIGLVQSVSCPIRASGGLQDGGRIDASDTEQNLDYQNATSNGDHSKVGLSWQESTKDDSGTTSVRALSAMPYMRRKRRKN